MSEDSGEFVANLEDDGALVFGVAVVALLIVRGLVLLLLLESDILMGHVWWHQTQLASLVINDQDKPLWYTTVI
jgi:hypothetical protein